MPHFPRPPLRRAAEAGGAGRCRQSFKLCYTVGLHAIILTVFS